MRRNGEVSSERGRKNEGSSGGKQMSELRRFSVVDDWDLGARPGTLRRVGLKVWCAFFMG